MFHHRNALLVLFVGGLAALPLAAHGGGPYRGPGDEIPPPPRTSSPRLVREDVQVRLHGASAETRATLVFRSEEARPAEVDLVIPLAADTVVSELRLTINDQPVTAEVLDPARARAVYESIVRRERDPALLEHVGHGCVRARIFPVSRGHDATVELTYVGHLRTVSGHREYVYPLRRLARRGAALAHEVVVQIVLETERRLTSITSPTHDFSIRRDGERHACLSYESGPGASAEDVRLLFAEADTELGVSLLSSGGIGNEAGTFLATLTPTRHALRARVPRDVVFAIDTSGSMRHDGKIDQARLALAQCIAALRPEDRFEVIAFSDVADGFLHALRPADEKHRATALHKAEQLRANGSTNVEAALERALRLRRDEDERPFYLFFLTDGRPTTGERSVERLLKLVERRADGDLRLFAFGVGYDVNTQLLDTLAERHRGEREYVLPGESIESKLTGLFEKVAEPFLSDVTLEVDGARTFEVFPPRVSDLYHGSSVTLSGRFEGGGAVNVRVRGRRGDREIVYVVQHVLHKERTDLDFLPTLWAWRKIGFLLDRIRLAGEERELVDEVRRLGLEHGLVTPYTAALAVEPGMRGFPGPGGSDEFHLGARRRLAPSAPATPSTPSGPTGRSHGGSYRGPGDVVPPGSLGPATPAGGQPGPRTAGIDPTTGEPAVRESLRTKKMKSTTVVPPTARAARTVEGKVFEWRDEAWTEKGFDAAQAKNVRRVEFLSEAYLALLAEGPSVARILALGERVIFAWGGAWYRIVPADGSRGSSPSGRDEGERRASTDADAEGRARVEDEALEV